MKERKGYGRWGWWVNRAYLWSIWVLQGDIPSLTKFHNSKYLLRYAILGNNSSYSIFGQMSSKRKSSRKPQQFFIGRSNSSDSLSKPITFDGEETCFQESYLMTRPYKCSNWYLSSGLKETNYSIPTEPQRGISEQSKQNQALNQQSLFTSQSTSNFN